MLITVNPEHKGQVVVALGNRIKAMLVPLEDVCRYREQRGADSASFDVTPRDKAALPFAISIAPGGIDVTCRVFEIRELSLDEAEVAVQIVAAVLSGQIRQVRQLKGNGAVRKKKTYVFDSVGQPIFKHRTAGVLPFLAGRVARTERVRFAPYRGL